ncbi:hypothetical protein [Nocardia sp. NRRL S-836]|uniref:hypothetical protein n=1 Tax=Nocardia sp. NRRL S-836 TaxID=1519492 RepID=UPI0006AFA7B7|nr:hypothetical protein [Nocardia sp. NRRL S-836]KOV84734.1 hypothetical protein ADL03_15830 [Nocardia sp. NRRL S-836]
MRTWSHEAAGYAQLIAGMEQAGLLTDDTIAGMGEDTNYLTEQKRRAVVLWEEVQRHANPHQWLSDIDSANPDDVADALGAHAE